MMKLKDVQGALADFNKAIQLDPNYNPAYYNRGVLKDDRLQDVQGALADYNRAIQLDPNLAIAYRSRASLKYQRLADKEGAIADLQQAAKLYEKQGNTELYLRIIKTIKKISN
jgi:tetratricopeptide (TPR) repeat protein